MRCLLGFLLLTGCATGVPSTPVASSTPAAASAGAPLGAHHDGHPQSSTLTRSSRASPAPLGAHHDGHPHGAAVRRAPVAHRGGLDSPSAHAHGDAHSAAPGATAGLAPGHAHGGPAGHRFEDAEAWAKVFDDPARDAWQMPAHVIELLAIARGMTVADLGAGTGYFVGYLSRAVGEKGKVLALDAEPSMVEYIRKRAAAQGWANVTAMQVPFDDPLLPAGAVDRVLVVDTWHHIADRGVYAKKLAAGLRPGGMVVVVDFTLETSKGPPRAHRVTAERVIAELVAGGLEARLLTEEQLPDQFVVVGRRRP